MSKIHSRRAVLAGIAASPALAAPALALSGPDPIFAAIEAHERAYAAVMSRPDKLNRSEEHYALASLRDDLRRMCGDLHDEHNQSCPQR
jgi:hypothetical protein